MYRKKGLVKMQGEKVTLQNIKGIGDKISEKILNSVGGEENLQKIVQLHALLDKIPLKM